MKRKLIFISTVCLVLLIMGCKKNNNQTSNKGSVGGGSTSTNTGNNTQGYYGILGILQEEILNFNLSSEFLITAAFFPAPFSNTNVTFVNVGTVSVNSTNLRMDNTSNPGGPVYADTTSSVAGPPFAFNISGNGSQPAFNLSYTQPYPALGDTSSIPSVITRSLGLSITFTNVTNVDTASIILEDLSTLISKKKTVINNSVQFTFSPTELSSLSPTDIGGITVNLLKADLQTVNSKKYLITLEKRHFRTFVAIQ
jgi:hypothetical protein